MLINLRGNSARVSNERTELIRRIRNLNPGLASQIDDLELDWWRIQNAANDTTEVLIYEAIGGFFGQPADEFVRSLNEIDTPNIDVRINSPGGSAFDAIAIYNALVKHPAYVRTYVDALAASAASIIAMAGDECIMMVGSQMMIHDALGIEIGNAADMRAFAKFLDQQSDNVAGIYAARAGGEASDWRNLMIAETWLMAQEAVESGLADSVYQKPTKSDDDDSEEDDSEDDTEADESADDDENSDVEADSDKGESDTENLMGRRFPLAVMGYRYAGRSRAPKPQVTNLDRPRRVRNTSTVDIDESELDAFITAMKSTLGGK